MIGVIFKKGKRNETSLPLISRSYKSLNNIIECTHTYFRVIPVSLEEFHYTNCTSIKHQIFERKNIYTCNIYDGIVK